MFFELQKHSIHYILWSLCALLWVADFHPVAIGSVVAGVICLRFRDRLRLTNKSAGALVVLLLFGSFVCTRTIGSEQTGRFLGIGTISLAFLASWLLAGSVLMVGSKHVRVFPLLFSTALMIACSMSRDIITVSVLSSIGVVLLVLALREALKLKNTAVLFVPLLFTMSLMGVLATSLQWSESKVSYLMGLFSLVPPSGMSFPSASSLNSLQKWNASEVVVLRGYGKDPPLYLVGRTFSTFDTNAFWRWQTEKVELRPDDQILLETKSGKHAISVFNKTELTKAQPGEAFRLEYPKPGNGYTLYAPRDYYGIAADLSQIHFYGDQMLQVLARDEINGEYFVLPFSPDSELDAPSAPLSDEERRTYLQLPEDLTSLVAQLGQEVAGKTPDHTRKAEFITAYLQQNFSYGYEHPFESNKTALEEFLRDRPPVHCEFFATAATLMMRSQGVPARYINGFVLQEKSLSGDYYVVRLKHAHAWVEAYLPGLGWTTYDPTPPGTLDSPDDKAEFVDALLEWFSNGWRRFTNFFSLNPMQMASQFKAYLQRLSFYDYLKFLALLGLYGLWKRLRNKPKKTASKKKEGPPYLPGRDARLTPTLEAVMTLIQPPQWRRSEWETTGQWLKRIKGSNLEESDFRQVETFVKSYEKARFTAHWDAAEISMIEESLEALTPIFKGKSLEIRETEA